MLTTDRLTSVEVLEQPLLGGVDHGARVLERLDVLFYRDLMTNYSVVVMMVNSSLLDNLRVVSAGEHLVHVVFFIRNHLIRKSG